MNPKVLVETGFMIALNPKDKYHRWALKILEAAKSRDIVLYVSPVAPIELSLVMRAHGLGDKEVQEALKAIDNIVTRYSKPRYPPLGLKELAYAAELRLKYHELTFFDSIHAAIAILNDLIYYDLDETVKSIIAKERKK